MTNNCQLLGGPDAEAKRREQVRRWVTAALDKPDPVEWVYGLFDDALRHLDGHPDEQLKAQAQRELFVIRGNVLADLWARAPRIE